jgi:acyl CoA:acetate/3-ketoacid CoA transferase
MGLTIPAFRKTTSALAAISFIGDDSVLAISGFNLAATPEHLILKLYES